VRLSKTIAPITLVPVGPIIVAAPVVVLNEDKIDPEPKSTAK